MKKSKFKQNLERGFIEGKVQSGLRQQMKIARLGMRWRSIVKDIKHMDTAMLDILLIDKSINTVEKLEHMVNCYLQMEYQVLKIEVKPREYRIGGAKEVFGQLAYDSENSRESEILFVGS